MWIDRDNDSDKSMESYTYYLNPSISSDYYFMVATYSHAIIPNACTTGTMSNGQSANYPVAYIAVYYGGTRIDYKYYLDQFHRPILIAASNTVGVEKYYIYVEYEYLGSPAPDYTLKVYSKNN